MSRKHFLVAVTRSGRRLVLLWFSNDEDGVVTKEGQLRTFSSESDGLAFAASAGLELGDESVTSYHLDDVDAWSSAPAPGALPLDSLLEAWNLLADIAISVGDQTAVQAFRDRRIHHTYDRLARSCIPALGASPTTNLLIEADYPIIAAALRHGLYCFDGAV